MAELDRDRPIVLITGAAGDLGSTLAQALGREHRVIGMDRAGASAQVPMLAADLTDARSVEQALAAFRERYGSRIASVIHLAAYFDFSGEEHPLYRKVNVVDDEAPIREALVHTLQDNGYRAYTAEDGSDALALFFQRRDEIKVVLTDLAMAQMDGLELVRALRKLNSTAGVIVSSGHCPEEQTIALEALGVRTFLDKPYNAGKLLRALREVLSEQPATSN